MSIIDGKAPIILDFIGKIGSDFQKMFEIKFGLMKILVKPTVLVNFYKFYFFSWGEVDFILAPPPPPLPHPP